MDFSPKHERVIFFLKKKITYKMASFYGRAGAQFANTPLASGLRDEFKPNTFVNVGGVGQTIPTAANVALACATTLADHLGNVTSPTAITISQKGFYQVGGLISCAGAVGGTTSLRIAFSVNGARATTPIAALAVDTLGVETNRVIHLRAGDVLSLWGQAVGADYTTAGVGLVCRYLGPSEL